MVGPPRPAPEYVAVELLERHQSTFLTDLPSTTFLLSASLVSRLWRPIAQLALLRRALIAPAGFSGFLEQLGKRGMLGSLRGVRLQLDGSGRKALEMRALTPDVARKLSRRTGEEVTRLLRALPALEEVELVSTVFTTPVFGSHAGGESLELLTCSPSSPY